MEYFSAYRMYPVHTETSTDHHPDPHLRILNYCWLATATILDAAGLPRNDLSVFLH